MYQEFAQQLPDKICEIETIWEGLHHGQWDNEVAKILLRLTHGLTGSGASFGFTVVSDAMRMLESELVSIIESAIPSTDAQRTQINRDLNALEPAKEAVNQTHPAAIIIDVVFPEGNCWH